MKMPYWHYFISLEDEIVKISKFIEICEDNFSVYSIELTKLLLSICSEVDVVAKLLCKEADIGLYNKIKGSHNATIETYRTVINTRFPQFHNVNVIIPFYNLSFLPWDAFKDNVNPEWWQQYNNVKHERNISFEKANLKNVLLSMAGLMVLLVYLYGRESVISLDATYEPKLYDIEKRYYRYEGTRWGAAQLGVPKEFIKIV